MIKTKNLKIYIGSLIIAISFSCQQKSRDAVSNKNNPKDTIQYDVTNSKGDTSTQTEISNLNYIYVSPLTINDYSMFLGEMTDNHNSFIIIRKFSFVQDSTQITNYLGININTLETKLINADNVHERTWSFLTEKYCNSNYIKLYQYAVELNNGKIHNSGLTNFSNSDCYTITTDLCPSSNEFEYEFYDSVIKCFSIVDTTAFPIGIALSGFWMKTHQSELNWLIEKENTGKMSITWINHSYYHKFIEGEPIANNFFLIENTNVEKEILETEKLMILNGLYPSIYFRFPGLASNKQLYSQVLNYGLIPLGCDSWIANGKFPQKGSIVLLHGNGNEPIGIEMFLNWLGEDSSKPCISSINQLCIKHFESNK
jgi:hypothetical protein